MKPTVFNLILLPPQYKVCIYHIVNVHKREWLTSSPDLSAKAPF